MRHLLCTLSCLMTMTLAATDFPIGIFMAEPMNEKTFQTVRDASFNYVQTYATGSTEDRGLKRTQTYLDLAHKHGLKVLFSLKSERHLKAGKPQNVTELVNRFKNHPAVGLWYLADEPDTQRQDKELGQLYRDVKQADPNRLVALSTCWSHFWNCYQDCLDIHMVDGYPVKDQDFPKAKLTNLTDYLGQAIALGKKANKPAMPIIQCFNWKAYHRQANIKKLPPEQFDALRYPNQTELRFQIWCSMAQVVPGIWFYSYYDNDRIWEKDPKHKLNTMKEFQNIFVPTVKELRQFTDMVDTNAPNQLILDKKGKLYLTSWPAGNRTFLVAANAKPANAAIRRSIPLKGDFDLKPWGLTATGNARIRNGQLTADLTPYQTCIWELIPLQH